MQAVYHATKAFVLSWSEALATELDETGIIVTVLCPGATDTDFFEKADAQDTKAFQAAMAPQDVAKIGYDALNGRTACGCRGRRQQGNGLFPATFSQRPHRPRSTKRCTNGFQTMIKR